MQGKEGDRRRFAVPYRSNTVKLIMIHEIHSSYDLVPMEHIFEKLDRPLMGTLSWDSCHEQPIEYSRLTMMLWLQSLRKSDTMHILGSGQAAFVVQGMIHGKLSVQVFELCSCCAGND